MDMIHQQVAELQQKIDYLIAQMAILTEHSHLPQPPSLRTPLARKLTDTPLPDRVTTAPKMVGLNRFRALQTNG